MSTDDDPEPGTTRITRKGQVTIPETFREAFGLDPGDEEIERTGDERTVVRKANRASARGMLVPDDTPSETREEIAARRGHRRLTSPL